MRDRAFPLPADTRQTFLELAGRTDCLILGELHGTREVPELIGALLDDLSFVGYGALAMELPEGEREPIMRWAAGQTDAIPVFFARPPTDGRSGEQALDLFRRAVAGGWQIVCFGTEKSEELETWPSRDSAMADNLMEQWEALCPDRKVVAVCGNLHSRLAPFEPNPDLWPSFAACLEERCAPRVVRSVDIAFHGGGFFNNERVNDLPVTPLEKIDLREEPRSGHSFTLHLPLATPATFLTAP